jgi:hypothetical protein
MFSKSINIQRQTLKMKKYNLILFVLVLLTSLPAGKIFAQSTVTAQVFAEVIPALTATEVSQLNFGRFSPETQGGTILITPEGSLSSTGTVAISGGTHNPASFYITGEGGATFSIILPTGPAVLSNTGSSKTMQVANWVSNPASGTGTGLLAQGSKEVKVGATLIVGTMEQNPVGIYTGTYAITFSYN